MKTNRMEKKILAEWQVLDGLYFIFLAIYAAMELFLKHSIDDWAFLLLLSLATLFLNSRQKKLYEILNTNEDGIRFFESIYSDKNRKTIQINKIFLNKKNDLFAVTFAVLFAAVMYFFIIREETGMLKVSFALFLFVANLPTGLAVARIVRYFLVQYDWIKCLKFDLSGAEYFEVIFTKRVRTNVLITAVVYCTLSLSSVLFTDLELNWIVLLYTIFAVLLICLVVLITDTMINYKKQQAFREAYEKINLRVVNELERLIDSEEKEETLDVLNHCIELKNILVSQHESKLNIKKLASNLGLLIITVIPIILQWILDSLNM